MKKKVIIIVSTIIVLALIGGGIYFMTKEKSDNVKFKEEYESLNGKKNDSGKKYLDVNIDKNNSVKYATYDELIKLLDSGTGVIYFGFPECPWCRNALPVLLKAAKETEMEEIYYFNAKDMRDTKELKDGKIVTTKEGTKEYYNLIDKLKDVLGPYDGLEDDSIKRLYFPTMVFVMGGKIVATHEGTVDSQEDPYVKLTEKQETELLDIYKENINKIYGTCDKSC